MTSIKTNSNNKDSKYYSLFKNIPPNFVKNKKVKFLQEIANVPIGNLERKQTLQANKLDFLCTF